MTATLALPLVPWPRLHPLWKKRIRWPWGGCSSRISRPAPYGSEAVPGGTIAGVMAIEQLALALVALLLSVAATAQSLPAPTRPIVLRAARLLDVKNGRMIKPGEVLVEGERIAEVGKTVTRPAGAELIDLGDRTLLPGLIDAHIHLFLHPGAEDLQTVQESVPQRTIMATLAARDDLMAGFTAERDMGTEGAGSADTAVRDAIDQGRIPGPRLRISGNAINILGGHEDAMGYNPEQHVLPNATFANNADELVAVIRQQFKEGADFIKIYETGTDSVREGKLVTPYQYTEGQLEAAVKEAARVGRRVAVHAENRGRCARRRRVWCPLITRINLAKRRCA